MEWYVYALAAAIFTAAATITQKKTLKNEHALEFSAVLAAINFAFTFLFLPSTNFNIGIKKYLIIYLASWLGSVAFLFIAKSIRHMELSSSSPLLNFGPGITAILAFIFLGEKITSTQIIGIGLLILGAYILEIKGHISNILTPVKELTKSKYTRYILFALLLYGFSTLIDRHVMTQGVSPSSYMFIVHGFIFLNYLIIITFFYDGLSGIKHGLKTVGKCIFLISAFTVAYRYFQIKAISMAYVALVVTIKRLSTILTTLIGGKIYHEKNLLIKVLGCIIMFWGAVFIIL